MKIAILDDDIIFVQELKKQIENILKDTVQPLLIDIYNEPVSFLNRYLYEDYNILFLDVRLPKANGIAIGKQITHIRPDVHIVLLSAYNYGYESYSIQPFQYLDKPVNTIQLKETLLRSIRQSDHSIYLFKIKNSYIPIPVHTIIYIQSSYDKLTIYTTNKTYIGSKRRNKRTFLSLNHHVFIKLDRSIYVNMSHIHKYDYTLLQMTNHIILDIPRNKRKVFKEYYFDYINNQTSIL